MKIEGSSSNEEQMNLFLKDDEFLDYENERNTNSLNVMASLKGILTQQEEIAFMQLLFSSSASIRSGNFGLSRKEIEKLLNIATDEELYAFVARVNQAISRYFRLIYDDKRDQLVVLMRVPASQARNTLTKESLAILLYIFYQQEVLQHEYTLFDQLLEALGHESKKANQKILLNLDPLKKIGAIEDYETDSSERAFQITAIGVHMFSDSFLRRTAEFSQSSQLNKEEVLKFFKRYNLQTKEENQ